jgi:hypothetical protein
MTLLGNDYRFNKAASLPCPAVRDRLGMAPFGGARQFAGTTGEFRQWENEDGIGVSTLELRR